MSPAGIATQIKSADADIELFTQDGLYGANALEIGARAKTGPGQLVAQPKIPLQPTAQKT